jgi:hypothetical protein
VYLKLSLNFVSLVKGKTQDHVSVDDQVAFILEKMKEIVGKNPNGSEAEMTN